MKHLVTSLLCAAALPLAAQAQNATISSITFDCEEPDSAAVSTHQDITPEVKLPDGVEIVWQRDDYYRIVKDGRYGVADIKGRIIVQPTYEGAALDTDNGYAILYKNNRNALASLKTGEIIIPLSNFSINPISEETAVTYNGKSWNLIDIKTGRKLLKTDVDDIDAHDYIGLCGFCVGGRWGLINSKGEQLVPCVYQHDYDDNKLPYYDNPDNTDRWTKRSVSPKYESIYITGDNKIQVSKDGKWGVVDSQFHELVPTDYDEAYGFDDDLCLVSKFGVYGFVNKQNEVVIPLSYDNAAPFDQGLAPVKWNGVWFFIGKQNQRKATIKGEYDQVYSLCEGLAKVENNGKYGAVDTTGRLIALCQYKDVFLPASEGKFRVEGPGGIGFVDTEGHMIAHCKYSLAFDFHNGRACVIKNDKFGYIDEKGNEVIPLIYDDGDVTFSDDGTVSVMLNDEEILIDKNGKRVQN